MWDNDNFKINLDMFYDYLMEILEICREAVPVLKKELDSISKDDCKDLDKTLKSQQTIIIQTKDFQLKTESYLGKLNIKANNVSEMVVQLPEKERSRFLNLLCEFERTIEIVNFYRSKCRALLLSKLYSIEKILEKQNCLKDSTTYSDLAAEVQVSPFPKTFEKKI